MIATMLINQTKNAFQERNENTIQPFYQDSGAMFYKNKLINVEDIVEHYEMNTDDNSEFEAYSSKISYLLTFENERGNIHKYISSVKPKNIGALYYYVIKDDKLENIFPEKDRKKLKPYISIDTKYEYNNKSKIYSLTSFITKHPIKTFTSSWIFFQYPLTAYILLTFFQFDNIDSLFISSIFSTILTFFLFFIIDVTHQDFNDKVRNLINQKENEERENILKTFI